MHTVRCTTPSAFDNPSDFGGDQCGAYTPAGVPDQANQYDLRTLLLRIDDQSAIIDGTPIVPFIIDTLALYAHTDMPLTLAVLEEREYVGGLTIFGTGFGYFRPHPGRRVYFSNAG